MDEAQILKIAQTLDDARLKATPLPQFSSFIKDFSRADAYHAQEEGIKIRTSRGEKIIGLKMGLTSEGKRKQMNLDSPLYGVLTDIMEVPHAGTFNLKGSIHPKIEPEIAFYINKDLKGKITRDDVLAATEYIAPALEILDSRYEGFKYFSMEDVIADNSSSSHFIIGPKCTNFKSLNLLNLKMQMKINGLVLAEGISSDISGDPVVSVIQLAELLSFRDQFIPANTIVLAGAATLAISLEPNMLVSLEVDNLEKMSLSVEE
ncbi:MAG: 4-oxalocrotonate decarboxylase [Bacteriovorax sp.]|nr:4-oxalocrotonate decarboxylase [Bacteriovorax sp.]